MKRVLSLSIVGALAASGLFIAVAPAQAKEITPGRAVVRIDAPKATVKKIGANSYRIVLPKSATGQWMGDRTTSDGKRQILVGDLTAAKLVNNWSNFKFAADDAEATLVWRESRDLHAAVIYLAKPRISDNGVVFEFTSDSTIPAQLTGASINLRRASGGTRSTLNTYTVSGDLKFSFELINTYEVKARIFNSSNNNTCWGTADIKANTKTSPYPDVKASVANNTCATVNYQSLVIYETSSENVRYGVYVDWPENCSSTTSTQGTATMYLKYQPPGSNQMEYAQAYSWPCTS